jgi:hypothetical protein
MKGGKAGRMEVWKDGRVEDESEVCKDGRVEGRKGGKGWLATIDY